MRNKIYNKVAAESKAIAFTIHLLLFTLITSCSQEAVIAPQDTPDALAMMNPDTPVGISAEMKTPGMTTRGNGQSVELTASTLGTYTLTFPGGTSTTAITKENITVGEVNSTNFPLYLKDFNLTEGNNRCVTRWALLEGDNVADYVLGWARLTAGDNGEPTLAFGELKHANAKITLVLKDDNNNSITLDDGVSASYILQGTSTQAVETVSGEELTQYLQCIQSLANDPKDDNVFSLNVYADETVDNSGSFSADGVAIVRPTPTGGNLVETDILTITVNTDPDGNGPQTTGTYKLKLSDVKLSETKNLTALKSGEHYILTVTLKHNTLVSATATVAGWNEVSADVTLQGNDPSRMPPYEYDEDTNTYTIWQEEGIMSCLQDKETNNRTDATVMYKGMAIDATSAELAIVSGAETVQEAIDNAIDNGKTTFIIMGDLTDNLCYYIKNCNAAPGTINLFLADATSIGESAFRECSALKSVNSPKVTSIGENAFESCSALTSVNFPKVTSIRNRAFVYCSVLTSVNFPEATFIGPGAFARCDALASVNLPKVVSIGHAAFHYCAFTDVNLPAVTSIDHQLFMDCKNLKSLTLGSVIGEVGQSPFMNVSTGDCALTLAAGLQHMTEATSSAPGTPNGTAVVAAAEDADEAARTWAGYTWKSITIK